LWETILVFGNFKKNSPLLHFPMYRLILIPEIPAIHSDLSGTDFLLAPGLAALMCDFLMLSLKTPQGLVCLSQKTRSSGRAKHVSHVKDFLL